MITEYKFIEGQTVKLFGMLDFPQFNDEIVEIVCNKVLDSGEPAYYIKTINKELANKIHWIYEKRLKTLKKT